MKAALRLVFDCIAVALLTSLVIILLVGCLAFVPLMVGG